VLPSHPLQPLGEQGSAISDSSLGIASHRPLEIPGLRDVALREYADWQQSKVHEPSVKADFQRACDVALKFYLEWIYENPDMDLFVEEGVPEGVAYEDFCHENKRLRLDQDEF
jgi:hypothetical protein